MQRQARQEYRGEGIVFDDIVLADKDSITKGFHGLADKAPARDAYSEVILTAIVYDYNRQCILLLFLLLRNQFTTEFQEIQTQMPVKMIKGQKKCYRRSWEVLDGVRRMDTEDMFCSETKRTDEKRLAMEGTPIAIAWQY